MARNNEVHSKDDNTDFASDIFGYVGVNEYNVTRNTRSC